MVIGARGYVRQLIVLLTAFNLGGCVTQMAAPQRVTGQINLAVAHHTPKLMQMPMGSQVTGRNLVYKITEKSDTTAATLGMFFGPLGVMAANQAMKNSAVGNPHIPWLAGIDMKQQTENIVRGMEELKAQRSIGLLSAERAISSPDYYRLLPYLYLIETSSGYGDLLVLLRVERYTAGTVTWKGQYVRFFVVDARMAEFDSPEDMEHLVDRGLADTMRFFIADINGRLHRSSTDVVIENKSSPNFSIGLIGQSVEPEIDGIRAFVSKLEIETIVGGTQLHPKDAVTFTSR